LSAARELSVAEGVRNVSLRVADRIEFSVAPTHKGNWYRKSRLQRINRNGVSLITSSRVGLFRAQSLCALFIVDEIGGLSGLDVEEAQERLTSGVD
jgi:hypothetical protein